MSLIIPTILARDEQEFRKRVAALPAAAPAFHIDVMNGTLVPERSFANPLRLAKMHLSKKFAVHLMINSPELTINDWLRCGATRIIIHAEATGNLGLALDLTRHNSREAGLAINPETDIAIIKDFAPFIDYIHVMSVHPGAMGRAFISETISRVQALRAAFPNLKIGVDGGVSAKKHTAHELTVAGADELCVGSAMWNSLAPLAVYNEIVEDATLK